MADWTAQELAEEAGVDPSYIRHEIRNGRLEATKRAGAWFIADEEAQRWLAIHPRHKREQKERKASE